MGIIAIIDTETNWLDQVMSIGTVLAEGSDFKPLAAKYHVLPIECQVGGMFESTLFLKTPVRPICCTRAEAMADLMDWLQEHGVSAIFAYNAHFDRSHLPELGNYPWYDIMRLAAYRQYNPHIPERAECFATGRLKRGYGVEAMLRLLAGEEGYQESHNAIFDALDELKIMQLLGHPVEDYIPLQMKK